MSDRTRVLTVVLDNDYRICDDAQAIINAIAMVRGVVDVKPNVADINTHTAYAKARYDLEKKLWDALKKE